MEQEPQVTPMPEELTPEQIIDELRENSIPREDFDKLQRNYTNLLAAYARGERSDTQNPSEAAPPTHEEEIKRLRNELAASDGDMTNLDYIKRMLQLREEIMANGGEDPFVPIGSRYNPTDYDRQAAQRVADGLQYCVDSSQDDPGVFRAMYDKIVRDPVIQKRR